MVQSIIQVVGSYSDIIWKSLLSLLILSLLILVRQIINRTLDRVMHGFKIAAGHRVYDLRVEEQYTKPMRHVISLAFFVIGLLIVLGIWGLTGIFNTLFLGAGLAVVILGFAAQGLLTDSIAGIMIFTDHPFRIGEWIKVGEVEGIVKDITLRATRVASFDGEYVTIPNRKTAEETVINKSRRTNLRIRIPVGIDYESDISQAIKIMLDALKSNKEVLNAPPPSVIVTEFGASSINLEIRFWLTGVMKPEMVRIRSEIITKIKKEFDRNGIKIPFQHIELIQHKS